jgi:hypothetical protein
MIDGTYYYGQWDISNKRCGLGILLFRDGSKYEGFWLNNIAHGHGRLIHNDGDIYEGQWLEGKAHGKGKLFQTFLKKPEADGFLSSNCSEPKELS